MPALAKEHTKAGAKAFIAYFFAATDYGLATLDVTPLRQIVSDGCVGCQSAIKTLQDMAAKHAHSVGGVTSVSQLVAHRLPGADLQPMQVDFTVTTTKQTITYPGSPAPEVHSGGSVRLRFVLSPLSAGWNVGYWGQP